MGRKRRLVYFALGLILYLGAYLSLRHAGAIVHFQNGASPKGPEVRAPRAVWSEIELQIAIDHDSPLYELGVHARRRKPAFLNFLFYPARMLEQSFYRSTG